MQYNNFKYIFPPRPERKIQPQNVGDYDHRGWLAQPKYNGSCGILFLGPGEQRLYNRHGDLHNPKWYNDIDFSALHSGNGWQVYCGELMNKAKKDEHNEKLTGFIIWDVLVHDSNYLIDWTNEQRLDLLENLFPSCRISASISGIKEYDHLCFTQFGGIYKAPVYISHFEALYRSLVETDAYEGMVLKKAKAKLEFGFNADNNSRSLLKVRKETKNYSF